MNKLECKQIDQNIKAGGLEDKERKIDLECSNGSAPKSICFQGETEPQHSFQTCRPFLYHIHRISRRSMLGCNQITHPMPPITLKSCQNEKHYGFFFLCIWTGTGTCKCGNWFYFKCSHVSQPPAHVSIIGYQAGFASRPYSGVCFVLLLIQIGRMSPTYFTSRVCFCSTCFTPWSKAEVAKVVW